MSSGRVQCFLISTRSYQVVYERFYDSFTEADKADIRAALHSVGASHSAPPADDSETTGRYKNGKIVMITSGELYFFSLGTGEYNELVLTELLRCIISSYKDIFKTSSNTVLTEDLLFQNYAATVMIVGEVLKEGLAELTDRGSIARSLMMKLPQIEGLEVKSKGGILGSMFSS